MPSYHFDLGNSTDGPIGFCARVKADSREEALDLLRQAMPDEVELKSFCSDDESKPAIEYLNVYLNAENVKLTDIDDEDEDDEDPQVE